MAKRKKIAADDEELRKSVRSVLTGYDAGEAIDSGSVDIIVKAARLWYGLNPLKDDFDVEKLTVDEMRALVKKDREKWIGSFKDELLRRGYVQFIYHEIRYEDGNGDENSYVLLLQEGEKTLDRVDTDDIIKDPLFNTDFDNVDFRGEAQDVALWEKDSLMSDVSQRLVDFGFKAIITKDDHYWTQYVFEYDGVSYLLAQTYKTRIGVIVDGKIVRPFAEPDNDTKEIYKNAAAVLKNALPDYFPEHVTWSSKMLDFGRLRFP
jgi:hypothetical protein